MACHDVLTGWGQSLKIYETRQKLDATHRKYASAHWHWLYPKANLGDIIAATALVILLKSDPNHGFFSQCDLEIWCMPSKNNREPLPCTKKLRVLFHIHLWIQTGVVIPKCWNWSPIIDFSPVWPWNFTHDLDKQQSTSSTALQAFCIISLPSVNSMWNSTVRKKLMPTF